MDREKLAASGRKSRAKAGGAATVTKIGNALKSPQSVVLSGEELTACERGLVRLLTEQQAIPTQS